MVASRNICKSHKSFQNSNTKLIVLTEKMSQNWFENFNYSVLTSKSLHLSIRGVIDYAEKKFLCIKADTLLPSKKGILF